MSSSIVTACGVSFDLPDGRRLLDQLSFTVDDGLSALVGPNGVGKTCLARLLAGELAPTSGAIRRHRPLALFAQRELPRAVPVGVHLADAYSWSELGQQLLDGIDLEAPCTQLSGGEWMRVRLTRALDEPFLILDEPTNDLDAEARRTLIGFLRGRPGGALVISHDRTLLSACQSVLELSNRGLTRFGVGWSDYLAHQERERDRAAEQLDVAKRRREAARAAEVAQHARQEKRDRRGAAAAARGGMPKILLGARKSRAQASGGARAVAAMGRMDDAVREAHDAFREGKRDPLMYADVAGAGIAAQRLVAEAHGFNVRYRQWLYREDLSFAWRGNVRVAVKGANGSGKSTLLQAIAGASVETRGTLRRGELRTLHLDQRLAQLDDEKSVLDNMLSSSSEAELRNGLARFLFAKETVFQRVGDLSGGERLRAALAQGFLRVDKPELLVLDEPTNNLDLPNIAFLEGLLRKFPGALVVISHDESFLEACALTHELLV